MKRATNKSSKNLNKSSVNVAGDLQTERDTDIHAKLKMFEEIETDQESRASSSEDMESLRSFFSKVRKWPVKNVSVRVHSQILKIREEAHLGEDVFGEYCLISGGRDKVAAGHEDLDFVLFSRPALPFSPLGSKANIS